MIHRVTGGGEKGVSGSPSDPNFWDPAGRFEFKARGKSVEQSPILPVLAATCLAISARTDCSFVISFPKAQLAFYKVCRFTPRMLIRNKRLTDALRYTSLLFQVTID